jgi:hypothetical protein
MTQIQFAVLLAPPLILFSKSWKTAVVIFLIAIAINSFWVVQFADGQGAEADYLRNASMEYHIRHMSEFSLNLLVVEGGEAYRIIGTIPSPLNFSFSSLWVVLSLSFFFISVYAVMRKPDWKNAAMLAVVLATLVFYSGTNSLLPLFRNATHLGFLVAFGYCVLCAQALKDSNPLTKGLFAILVLVFAVPFFSAGSFSGYENTFQFTDAYRDLILWMDATPSNTTFAWNETYATHEGLRQYWNDPMTLFMPREIINGEGNYSVDYILDRSGNLSYKVAFNYPRFQLCEVKRFGEITIYKKC